MLPAGVEACSQNHFSTASTLYSAPTVLVAALGRIGAPGVVCNRKNGELARKRIWTSSRALRGVSEASRGSGGPFAKGRCAA